MFRDQLGRLLVRRCNQRKPIGYVILQYPCRAIEWLHFRKLFTSMLTEFHFEHLIPELQNIMFAWKYHDDLSMLLYKPSKVFKQFDFISLLDSSNLCACHTAKRFQRYIDPQTIEERSSFISADVHVRTTDVHIIQNLELRNAVGMGLNHIPVKPTSLSACLATTMDALSQIVTILNLEATNFPISEASEWLRSQCLLQLKVASKTNKFGFKFSGKDLFQIPAVRDEVSWITKHLYCAGLDKATNNVCFICIKHIRLLALERLSSQDFTPCRDQSGWELQSYILKETTVQLHGLIPELQVTFQSLPYLMATYKLHKGKYRWLTNAFQTIYSNLAHLLTIASMLILDTVKNWAADTCAGYANFLRCKTSLYWLINSVTEMVLNLPVKMHDIFVADITRCFESIPLHGPDNLLDAVSSVIKIAYRQARKTHPRATPLIWIRVDQNGMAARAVWGTSQPAYGEYFSLNEARLISLHAWLMTHCHVALGDRVWTQTLGIPMGFSCSPLWCNVYLLSYEIKFIQRLARLGRVDLMSRFKYAFRYIDDLCWVNNSTPMDFLDPEQPRTNENPFWIYPLNVIEIKCEVTRYAQDNPTRGLAAHFMNLEISISDDVTGSFETCKFDKRRELPFSYTQYIKFKSNRPIRQSYSVAVSQTVPILYLSSSVQAALREINILINTMTTNGFQCHRLHETIIRFLTNGHFPGIKFDIQALITSL